MRERKRLVIHAHKQPHSQAFSCFACTRNVRKPGNGATNGAYRQPTASSNQQQPPHSVTLDLLGGTVGNTTHGRREKHGKVHFINIANSIDTRHPLSTWR